MLYQSSGKQELDTAIAALDADDGHDDAGYCGYLDDVTLANVIDDRIAEQTYQHDPAEKDRQTKVSARRALHASYTFAVPSFLRVLLDGTIEDIGGSAPRKVGKTYVIGNSLRCVCHLHSHTNHTCDIWLPAGGQFTNARALAATCEAHLFRGCQRMNV